MNLSNQSKEILASKRILRENLSKILPQDLVDYIVQLIAKDQAHQKLLNLLKD